MIFNCTVEPHDLIFFFTLAQLFIFFFLNRIEKVQQGTMFTYLIVKAGKQPHY